MDWFKNNVFRKYYNKYHQDVDSYKNPDGKGILQRFEEGKYAYWDVETIPLIENFAEKTIFPETMEEGLLTYAEESLGADLFSGAPFKRRLALKYFLRLCRLRCTPLGFETLIRLTDFGEMVFYTVDVHTFFDNPLPFAGVNAWYEYEIQITGNMLTLLPEQARKLSNASRWNQPINCKLKETGIVYNGSYMPVEFVEFFYDNTPPYPFAKVGRSPDLFIEQREGVTVAGEFNQQGNLLLTGDFVENYELDTIYFGSQGKMMFRYQGDANDFPPFNSFLAQNVTENSFRISWENVPNAVKYYVDIGTTRGENEDNTLDTGIIGNRLVNRLDVGVVTEYDVVSASENTVYFFQVFAEHSDGRITYSSINWVMTKISLDAPENLRVHSQLSEEFILSWDITLNATGYILDVAKDVEFTDFVEENLTLRNIQNQRVLTGETGVFYARIKAIKNCIEGSQSIESQSVYSNILIITLS